MHMRGKARHALVRKTVGHKGTDYYDIAEGWPTREMTRKN